MTVSAARACLALLLSLFMLARAEATQLLQGVTSDGAAYAFALPDGWNGDLVIYGHGIVDPAAPLALPSTQDHFDTIKEALLLRGFAVGYTSYAENGYALADAARQLRALRGLFADEVRPAGRVYLMGHSLGAVAVQMVAEGNPRKFDGALAMCGFLGGGSRQVQYLGDVRVLFDAYFPGVLPGDVITVPPGLAFSPGTPLFHAVLNALLRGFVMPGAPTVAFAAAAKIPYATPQELIAGTLSAIGFNIRFTNDLLDRTGGHPFYDNTGTVYPPAVDGLVGRFAASTPGTEYFERNYEPSGDLSFPMLTLHTTRDAVVPVVHQSLYATRAPAEWLVQRTISRAGHCAITPQEAVASFDDMVRWVTDGTRPTGADVTAR